MKTSLHLACLFVLTLIGCGQVEDNSTDLSTRNDLLVKSINADYEKFENTPIYRRTKAWYPKRLQPLFRFLTEPSSLKDNSLQQQRLDTLGKLKNQILSRRIIGEQTINLCQAQLASIEEKLNETTDFGKSNKAIESFRNEVLQLEKIVLYADLQDQYYTSFSLIDTLAVKVIPESETVILGEPYRAKVYLASYISLGHEAITIYEDFDTKSYNGINPLDTFQVKRGRDGFIEFYPKEVGKNRISIVWPIYANSNHRIRFVTEASFTVKK